MERKTKGQGCMVKVRSVGVVKALVVISSSVKEDRVCSASPQIYRRTDGERNEISVIKWRTDGEEEEDAQRREL